MEISKERLLLELAKLNPNEDEVAIVMRVIDIVNSLPVVTTKEKKGN